MSAVKSLQTSAVVNQALLDAKVRKFLFSYPSLSKVHTVVLLFWAIPILWPLNNQLLKIKLTGL